MENKLIVRAVAVLFAVIMAGASAFGFIVRTDESGVYVVKWHRNPVVMQVKLSATANLIDGSSQRNSVASAMQIWNDQLGTVQLSPQFSQSSGYSAGNGTNEIVMDSTVDGDAFPSGVLAITLTFDHGNDAVESDIIFNTAYSWNSYRGSLINGIHDIRRVAIHELGHVLGLDHPDEGGQFVSAIMNSHITNVDTLRTDDINGGRKLYGATANPPANDAFASATSVTLFSGTQQFNGSTISATRQSGERDHATSTSVHSIWWKWTAANHGRMTVNTLGSDFDTVVAVYTGSSVSSLNEIVSNDDEEPFNQNSPPTRKRTSLVTFNAVAGTTYYIAVDGWGDTDGGLPSGYTGNVTLSLSVEIVGPFISQQPADQNVEAGQNAFFSIVAGGNPTPTLRWQRLPAGGGDWTNLTEGGAYTNTTQNQLRVSTTLNMNGDRFRCVLTNSDGSVTSAEALLTVRAIPLPVITQLPQGGVITSGTVTRLSVVATSATSYQWFRNGVPLPGQTTSEITLSDPKPADAGVYRVVVSNGGGSVSSNPPAILAFVGSSKLSGAGAEVGTDIVHANGNIYDQVALQGAAVSVKADPGQILRVSCIDLSNDIVQVEFSGAGTLSLVLDAVSGPNPPINYNQPGVTYMKGHAGIVIAGADETTHLSVFSVGRINAVNQSLFRDDVTYDGMADLAFIAILSANGKFGSLRAANSSFFATSGMTGIFAPNVQFTGPVFIGEIQASDTAEPVLLLGSASDVRIAGGDLSQPNNRAVQVSGIAQLRFVDGSTSHGILQPAQTNRGRLEQNGSDITSQIVVNPP